MTIKNTQGLIDPAWVVRQRQIVRTEVLETMLIQHGFTKGPATSGSHVKFSHPELTRPVIIVAGTDDLGSQKEAAKKCIEAGEIKAQKRAEARAAKRSAVEGKGEFDRTSGNPLVRTLEHLPKDIEGFEFEGLIVVRPKKLKQIGNILPTDIHPRELDEQCEVLRKEAREMLAGMGEGNREFETSFHFEHDHLILVQPRYGLVTAIPPYHPDNEEEFLDATARFGYLLQSYDHLFMYNVVLAVKTHDEAGRLAIRPNHRAQDITCTFSSNHFITGEVITDSLTCSFAGRPDPQEFFRWVDEGYENSIGGPGDSRFLSSLFIKKHGFEVRRPKGPRGTGLGDKLVFTHPFYPKLHCEITAPDTIPRAATLAREYVGEDGNYFDEELLNRLMEKKALSQEITEALVELRRQMNLEMERANREVFAPLTASIRDLGLDFVSTKRIKPGDYGKVGQVCLYDPITGERSRLIPTIFVSDHKQLLDPNNLDNAWEFIEEIRKRRQPKRDLGGGTFGSGGSLFDRFDFPGPG